MKKGLAALGISIGMILSAEAPVNSNSNFDFLKYNSIKFEQIQNPRKDSKENINYSTIEEKVKYPYLPKKRVRNIIDSLYNELNPSEVISPKLFEKFIEKESNFNYKSYNSGSGASGLSQVTRIAWKQVFPNLDYDIHKFNPELNIEAGLRYISWLENTIEKSNPYWKKLNSEEKIGQIVAGYNAGIKKLKTNDWDFSKMPKETKNYLNFILDGRKS